jgi:hypothetical protein
VLRTKLASQKGRAARLHRACFDLSFLVQTLRSPLDQDALEIEQVQVSVVLCGTSEVRYTVYCFEDNDHDDDRQMGDDEFSEDGFQADQVARGEIDANQPTWNPREYFLVTLLGRVKQVAGEWARIVQIIDSAFDGFGGSDPCFGSNIISASFWTRKMLCLLGKLLRTIQETNKAWQTFISNNGDIAYFSDIGTAPSATRKRIERALHQIHETFGEVESFQGRLIEIQKECEKLERALEVRLMVEANRNTELTILYICPITVVSAFFSIPDPFIRFKRNGWTFVGSVVLITAIVYLLRLFVGGKLRRQLWWGKFATRARAARRGDRTNNVQTTSGRVIRRRATHPAVSEQE